jgi:protein O-GlcNAc transferase
MKKVISYSLWGNNQFYTVNCVRNADLAKEFFPDWTIRVYAAPTVPRGIIEALIERGNTEIIHMKEDESWNGMFWRFYAAGDPSIDVMISRDADSLLNIRDKAAVDAWLASDKDFHIMRDNGAHTTKILGGMWGARNKILPNMMNLIDSYSRKNTNNRKNIDQEFLAGIIYPLVIDRALVHDPLKRYGHGIEFPIPRKQPWYENTLNGEWRGCEWIGDDNDYIGKIADGGCTHREYHKNFEDKKYLE